MKRITRDMLAAASLMALIATSGVSPKALAATGNAPVVSGSVVRDRAQITFEWPQKTYFTTKVSGTRVTLEFDRSAKTDFGQMLRSLYPYVVKADVGKDGKNIILTLDKPYKVRSFVSNNVSGLELIGIDPNAKKTAKDEAKKKDTEAAKKPEAEAKKAEAEAKKREAEAKKADIDAKKREAEAKKAETEAKKREAEAKKAEAKKRELEAAKHNNKTEQAAPAVAVAEIPASEEEETPTPSVEPAKQVATAKPHSQASAATSDHALNVTMDVNAEKEQIELHFPWKERVAAASYFRSGYLWVVFNRAVPLNLQDIDTSQPPFAGPAEQLPHESGTILRIPVHGDASADASREEQGFAWTLSISAKPALGGGSVKVDINTEPPLKPHIFLPVLEVAEPVAFSDPDIGDELLIAPFYRPHEFVNPPRKFVEFNLLQTAQGVVVQKIADDVKMAQLRNGVRVYTPAGSSLTPGLPEPEMARQTSSGLKLPTLFPYEEWKAKDPDHFMKELQSLRDAVMESKNPNEANQARLKQAQFLLGEGFAPESIGILQNIKRIDPAFYQQNKLAALEGAAYFLVQRHQDAQRLLNDATLDNNAEIAYWRAMTAELLGAEEQQFDYLANNDDYISKYPPRFRQKLGIIAADRSVNRKDYAGAVKILDSLAKDKLDVGIADYVAYLMGKISAETGQMAAALEAWEKLADNYQNPFVRARAEYSLVAAQLAKKDIDRDNAIYRLARLSAAWRGDGLELNVLSLLSRLYDEKEDYQNAIRTWRDIVSQFPNTKEASEAKKLIAGAFVHLFNDGGADSMQPLDALALFSEFREYTPAGPDGEKMIRNLADRLVSVDLLEPAAALLEQQVRFRLEKEERSRVGGRLAAIYLLNRKPEKALGSLQASVYGDNPRELQMRRDELAAQAYLDMKQPEKALKLVATNFSDDGNAIRLDAYWQKQDWQGVIETIETMLKKRKETTAPLTESEADQAVMLALAYSMENDQVQLQYMRDYFTPLIQKTSRAELFSFLTQPELSPSASNFDEAMKNVSEMKNFLSNYRTRVQKEGLSNVVP